MNYLLNNTTKKGSYYSIDIDKIMNVYNLDADFYADGAGLFTIDSLFNKQVNNNAFCATKHTVHNACSNIPWESCCFNNIVISLRYAISSKYNLKRLAIIDFDIHHHSNGIEKIFANDLYVLMSSFIILFFNYIKLTNSTNMCNTTVKAYTDSSFIRDTVNNKWIPNNNYHNSELILIYAIFDIHR